MCSTIANIEDDLVGKLPASEIFWIAASLFGILDAYRPIHFDNYLIALGTYWVGAINPKNWHLIFLTSFKLFIIKHTYIYIYSDVLFINRKSRGYRRLIKIIYVIFQSKPFLRLQLRRTHLYVLECHTRWHIAFMIPYSKLFQLIVITFST